AAGGVGLEVLRNTTTMRGGRIDVGAGATSVGIRVAGSTTGNQAAKAALGDATPGAASNVPIRIQVPGGTGGDVAPGKSADLVGVDIRGAATGLKAAGAVTLDTTLIAAGGPGSTGAVLTGDTGARLTARYVTIAGNGTGISSLNGDATTLQISS